MESLPNEFNVAIKQNKNVNVLQFGQVLFATNVLLVGSAILVSTHG